MSQQLSRCQRTGSARPGRGTARQRPRCSHHLHQHPSRRSPPAGAAEWRRPAVMNEAAEQGEAEPDEDDSAEELPELSSAQHIVLTDDFWSGSDELRAVFDKRFADPRKTSRTRFLWDYWHVPQQYTLMRTQAQAYFPPDLHDRLVDALISYGESRLGCRAISPIWMSYYVDGCCQELHADSFHGPFAFVLSLTRWDARRFTGGETMILQPSVLNFWEGFDPTKGLELTDLVTLVPPCYNRLTVFDPRFPHGVRPVRGNQDPLEARLVLHGWFTDPSPFFDGPLDQEAAQEALNDALDPLLEALGELPPVLGTLSCRFTAAAADGRVAGVTFLADTLVVLPQGWTGAGYGEQSWSAAGVRAAVQHTVVEYLTAARFPACEAGDTLVTLPLVFE